MKESPGRHEWRHKCTTDRWIELFVPVNTVMLSRLYPCCGERLFKMSEFWYFVDLRGTPAGNTELRGTT